MRIVERREGAMRLMIAAICFATAVSVGAGIEHTILHGVSVGEVRVGIAPDPIPDLTEQKLQSLIESRLREANIPIVQGAPGVLWVDATAVQGDASSCFVHLDARLLEEAKLERNGLRVQASSWHRGGVVSGPSADCGRRVVDVTDSFVRDFVRTYEAMNPKR
jgi:hypothetical protein